MLKNFYPKRNKYLNLWMPIIVDKTNNGTMEVALGSHLKEYPFLEFKGYSKDGKISNAKFCSRLFS